MPAPVFADGDNALGISRTHYPTRRIVRKFGKLERRLKIARLAMTGEKVTHADPNLNCENACENGGSQGTAVYLGEAYVYRTMRLSCGGGPSRTPRERSQGSRVKQAQELGPSLLP